MRCGRWCSFAGLVVASAACGLGGHGSGAGDAQPADSTVRVEILNHNPLPVDIIAVGGGMSHRLGTVLPGLAGHFVVPPAMLGDGTIEIEARVANDRDVISSGPLLLARGDVVDFTVGLNQVSSTAVVRN
jgi:hypothetical protein